MVALLQMQFITWAELNKMKLPVQTPSSVTKIIRSLHWNGKKKVAQDTLSLDPPQTALTSF